MIFNWPKRYYCKFLSLQKELSVEPIEITSPDDFISDDEGIDKLDAICLMLIAIGESLKKLDQITNGELLKRYPDIDWIGAKGMRDIISHHYFDLKAEVVYDVCRTKLPQLIAVIENISSDLKK